MRIRRVIKLFGILALCVGFPTMSSAQQNSIEDLVSKLEYISRNVLKLDSQMQDIQRRVFAGGEIDNTGLQEHDDTEIYHKTMERIAELETRLDLIEQKRLREFDGEFDELRNLIDRMDARLEKLVADVDDRLGAIEGHMLRTSSEVKGSSSKLAEEEQSLGSEDSIATTEVEVGKGYEPSGAPRVLGKIPLESGEQSNSHSGLETQRRVKEELLPEGTAEERYKFAFNLLRSAKYERADKVLDAFIQIHGDHKLAENASYWRGETYYARKLFGDAARIYGTNLQRYPDGTKAPDNMVKFGMALANLKRNDEACQAFKELERKYPEMPLNVRQAAKIGRNMALCP